MKVLVTGGLGFVGSNVCIHRKKKGDDVIALDNCYKQIGLAQNSLLLKRHNITFEYADIRNYNDIASFFKKNHIDVVFHLAAQVAFKRSIENPLFDFQTNAVGTFNLLEAIRIYSPHTLFICASTNQVYGAQTDLPLVEKETRYDYENLPYGLPETYPLDFLSPYGCSKGTADQYTRDYARIYGLKTVVTRFGGIFGINQWAYEDHGWVSFMTEMVLKDVQFNRFGNGKQVRDVLYISDIINALDLCVEKIDTVNGEIFNIGGGVKNSISVLELLKMLEKLTGHKEKSIVNKARDGDKLVAYLDIRKAEKLLQWKPQVSAEEGIKKLIEWMKIRSEN